MSYKPRPLNKREFLNKIPDPVNKVNPNTIFSEPVKPGEPEFNRAHEVSLKGDTDKDISIGIKDIDEAILFYFNNALKLSVVQNNTKINVPVIYGSPERWKAVQEDGFYRDNNSKIQVPLIMFKRENIEKNRTLGNKLDGNNVSNVMVFKKRFSRRNVYDNFYLLSNQTPEDEWVITIVPDYVTITYNCILFTDFVEQMDKLIEAINFASDSYWGDPSKFQFRTRIDSFATQTIVEQGADRAVKTTFSMILNGYLIPDAINAHVALLSKKFHNATKVIFNSEIVTNKL